MGSTRDAGMPHTVRAGQRRAYPDITCGRGGASASCGCRRRGVMHWCCRPARAARSRPRDGAYPGACTGDVGAGRRPGCGRGRGGITVVRLRAGSRCRHSGRPGRPGGRRQVSPAGPRAAAADRRACSPRRPDGIRPACRPCGRGQRHAAGADQGPGSARRARGRDGPGCARVPAAGHPRGNRPSDAARDHNSPAPKVIWKDFYARDHPMMNAPQTMTRTPLLSMISYQ